MARWPIFDPHTHIDPHRPAARHFEEILGYHYYTELAHSAGMPAQTRFRRRSTRTNGPPPWSSISIASIRPSSTRGCSRSRGLFIGFPTTGSLRATLGELLKQADHRLDGPEWDREVFKASGLEAVFLTNEFDDPLEGWDTTVYVPCLRVDDLVLKLHERRTMCRGSRRRSTWMWAISPALKQAIGRLFERFVAKGARAAAVSLPPDFAPRRASHRRASTPIRKAIHGMDLRADEIEEVRCSVFWTVAEFCADFRLPLRPDDRPDSQRLSAGRCRRSRPL